MNQLVRKYLPENTRNHLWLGASMFGAVIMFGASLTDAQRLTIGFAILKEVWELILGRGGFALGLRLLIALGFSTAPLPGQPLATKLKPIDRATDIVEWAILPLAALADPWWATLLMAVGSFGYILFVRNVVDPWLRETGSVWR